MIKSIRKVIAVSTICVLLLFIGVINVSATTLIMDNDALTSSGVTNPFGPYEGSGTFSYITNSGLYNGDARMVYSPNGGYYVWKYASVKPSGVFAHVYLNHSSFTDPKAEYVHHDYYGSAHTSQLFSYLNQNTALSGWNYIGHVSISGRECIHIGCRASRTSGTYMGADAIRVMY